jgi:beta-lactamase regulating signal transducer with metallopeptidase domain
VGEWATILLRWGLGNAVSSAALAVLVAAVTLPLRRTRPAIVHALWLLVLLKLITPALWNVNLRQPKAVPTEAPTRVEDVRVVYPAAEEPADVEEPEPTPAPAAAVPHVTNPTDWRRIATTSAAVAWACGSGACLMLIMTRSLQFRRLLRFATPAPADAVRQVRAVARRLGMDDIPAVRFIPGAVCPMLYAFVGRARLLLPGGLWDRLTVAQRDTLIAHELAHYRRRDHWVRLVEVAATVVQWWNPVLWLARRHLREAEEQCCDAWVVWSMPTAVRDYMSAILEAVEYVSEPNPDGGPPRFARAAVPALASGLGEFRRLERRLHMIRQNSSPRRLGRLSVIAMLCAAGGVLPLAPTLAQVETSKPETSASEDRREIVVTQAEVAPGAQNPGADVAPYVELRLDPLTATVTAENDVVVTRNEPEKTSRIVDGRTGKVVEVRGKTINIVDGSELDQARAEVDRARANLEMAQRRLKELESRASAGGDKGGWSADGKTAWKESKPKKEAKYGTSSSAVAWKDKLAATEGDQEKRMERLEQRLEKLDALLRDMQKSNEDRGRDRKNAENLGNRQ